VARHHRARAAAAALALLCLTGCGTDGLQFRNDHRLSFVTPEERAKVTAPLTVEWTMRDFTPTGLDGSTDEDRGVFAVFVDRAPMPSGKDLKWLFRNDSGCKHDARCPSLQQLEDRGVLITTQPRVTIEVLPQVGEGVGDEQHYVNVVVLDGTGRRHGESAWYLPFQSKRRST
jgi:hypothetical protein